ncbi:hypothetical protein K440DRAFT_622293 [Wilcoxina mikolae CBS 423.85]|nr:hypothetical protein K440DRAFT_622293 [Wilcoxina mikolae CBS 423.85]
MRFALYSTLVFSLSVATLGAPAADRDNDRGRGNRGKLSVYKREPHPPTGHENWGPMLVFTKDGGPPKEQQPKKRDPGVIVLDGFSDPGHKMSKRHVETKQEKQDDYEYWGGGGYDDDSEYWGPEDDADMEHGSTKGSLIPGL